MFKGVEIFSDLSDNEKEKLSMFCQEQVISAGETLFLEDEVASSMYILKSGNIEISREVEGKKIIIGEIINEGILGEMALFGEPNNRMASAVALTESKLVVVLDFSIKELTKVHPELLKKIKNIIDERNTINNK